MTVEQFVGDLEAHGLRPREEAGLVLYEVLPVEGVHAGTPVETGVATEELAQWPQVPPHWIHLPSAVSFSKTNSRSSPRPGWTMHSRNLKAWDTNVSAGINWLAHVRCVLGDAAG